MKRRPKYAKPPREEIDENVYLQSWISQAGDHIEKYTVGLPATAKEALLDGVKREFNARWLVRYDIEDLLGSREEYQELPGAKGMTITAHPLEWVKDPWKVVSKFSINAWGAVSDFQDFSNEFIWEFSVGPMLQKLGLAEVETVPKDIEIPGLRNPVKVSGRLIPKIDPQNNRPDPLGMALREFIRFRSSWPERWSSGLLPTQAIIMFRFAAEVDGLKLPKTDPLYQLAEEMRSRVVTYWDDDPRVKAVVSSTLLDARDSADEIKKRARLGVFNPNRAEADYTNQIGNYYKKMSQTLDQVGNLSPGLEKLRKVSTWLNQEELVCLTNDLVQAGLEGSITRTYLWRFFRGIKVGGKTFQNWIRTPVDFIKDNIPVAKQLNRGLTRVVTGKVWDPARKKFVDAAPGAWQGLGKVLDRIQTVVLSKLTTTVRKLGLEKVFASVITAGLGAATGGVGIVVGALVKNIAGGVLGNILGGVWKDKGKIFAYGCGCLGLLLATPMLMFMVIMSAFKVPMMRMGIGGAGAAQSLVTITKTANPTRFSNDVAAADRRVTYTVTIENKATENASISNLADNKKATIPETSFELAAGQKKIISYQATIPDGSPDGDDFAHLNTVSGTATVGGKTIPLSASAVVIVGNPPDMQPSGWPTSGAITQCPFNNPPIEDPTHTNTASIDIANNAGTEIFATHNGAAEYGDQGSAGYGKYVAVSNGVTRTVYAHLLSISDDLKRDPRVTFGQKIGTMDDSGNSRGSHLHYEITRLVDAGGNPVSARSWMAPPYIPPPGCPAIFGTNVSR